jgi:crotonobetainyl-CoA:carnitine CoA-transferase CaiB-like acyl-CoA transferase
MAQSQRFWEILCTQIGRLELTERADFADIPARLKNRDMLTKELDAHLSSQSTAHWMERLGGFVPCGPVFDMADALDNPFLRDRGDVVTVPHPNRADLKVVQNPIRLSDPLPNRPAPALGADTDDILRELGYDDNAIRRFRSTDVT